VAPPSKGIPMLLSPSVSVEKCFQLTPSNFVRCSGLRDFHSSSSGKATTNPPDHPPPPLPNPIPPLPPPLSSPSGAVSSNASTCPIISAGFGCAAMLIKCAAVFVDAFLLGRFAFEQLSHQPPPLPAPKQMPTRRGYHWVEQRSLDNLFLFAKK
jgi:hypothetical protein